jgi:flagellar basal-body rod protein FlgB
MAEFAAGKFNRVLARQLLSPFCMEILRPEQQVMQAALQVRSARAELLAGNVANADTPGYIARDLKFDAAMDQVLDAGSRQDTPISSDSLVKPENLRFDSNDVDVNQQLAKSFDNSLSYVATLKLYGDSMNRLVSATSTN